MITFQELKNFRNDAKAKRKSNRDLLKSSIVDFFNTYKSGLDLSQETFTDEVDIEYPYIWLVDSDGKKKSAESIIIDPGLKASFQLYTVVDDNPSRHAVESVLVSAFISNEEVCYKISGLSRPEKTFNDVKTNENLVEISEFIKQSLLDKMASEYGVTQKFDKGTVNLWD